MQVLLVPSIRLAKRVVGPTEDPAANQALFQRYAGRLQAQLGIGFQVHIDQSEGYDLLNATDYDTESCWVLSEAAFQTLTTDILAHHRIISLPDQAVVLKDTQLVLSQLKPTATP
ncbi:hypothetical protein [Lactiplantibacillus mudanjiangensis]|uniref:Uncharacterized protein n=1 Tax=Lactiplantibacillus mudanjiangensis TaxID=1296538 RepID=A0A660E6R7_9LACO|nr:hypothetical protein [Lactiplantibacillus mudanjiangensis]VDG19448.1 hypothetical protein MUDAN_BIHEEGNE_01191 [Lactiplantibacillus mudanjiangensis]VDG25972.1 hypothetical protein MUDAN_IGPPGNFN_03499 [Lactiplantibacillus mudanjiangensis]VDG27971.1 hypothetical protein MUDAN_MDHGFNIF_02781 [Lactiplantibacillus mudanjiangensis]VDG30900.1 hypothetical protein MUDAN_DOGOELCO_00401 [Lactiplantibacillus mudanjiangensis]